MKDSISLAGRLLSFCISDIDGDSKKDIITLSNRKGHNSIIGIFLNRSAPGLIKFEKNYSIETNGPAYYVAAEDLDGDQKTDLIAADFEKKSLTFLANSTDKGSINFSKSTYDLGIRPNYFIAKDINGDKKTDLIIAGYDKNVLLVLQNSTSSQGRISFTQVDQLNTGNGPVDCIVDDLDGDKMPDIAVVNLFANSAAIYRNVSFPNSQAQFEDATVTISVKRPNSLASGDLDNDGMPELAISSEQDNNTVILKNYSSLHHMSFEKAMEIPVGSAQQHVYMKEIGKSKQPDLIVSNSDSDNFLVLKQVPSNENLSSFMGAVSLLKQDESKLEEPSVYPNPARSKIQISLSPSATVSADIVVSIVNALGKEIICERHSATDLITVDIRKLAAGFHWVRLSSPGHNFKTIGLAVE